MDTAPTSLDPLQADRAAWNAWLNQSLQAARAAWDAVLGPHAATLRDVCALWYEAPSQDPRSVRSRLRDKIASLPWRELAKLVRPWYADRMAWMMASAIVEASRLAGVAICVQDGKRLVPMLPDPRPGGVHPRPDDPRVALVQDILACEILPKPRRRGRPLVSLERSANRKALLRQRRHREREQSERQRRAAVMRRRLQRLLEQQRQQGAQVIVLPPRRRPGAPLLAERYRAAAEAFEQQEPPVRVADLAATRLMRYLLRQLCTLAGVDPIVALHGWSAAELKQRVQLIRRVRDRRPGVRRPSYDSAALALLAGCLPPPTAWRPDDTPHSSETAPS